jgi:hypothetical protein
VLTLDRREVFAIWFHWFAHWPTSVVDESNDFARLPMPDPVLPCLELRLPRYVVRAFDFEPAKFWRLAPSEPLGSC